jgi:hypothetical protein
MSIVTPAGGCARIDDLDADLDSQSVSRSINDRIRKLEQPWAGTYSFVCECEDAACTKAMHLTEQEYDDLRAGDGQHAMLPGHERVGTHRIVSRTDRFVIVGGWLH